MYGLSLEGRTHDLLGIPLMINLKFAWSLFPPSFSLVPCTQIMTYFIWAPFFSQKLASYLHLKTSRPIRAYFFASLQPNFAFSNMHQPSFLPVGHKM